MALNTDFKEMSLEDIHPLAEKMKQQGARFVQMLAVDVEGGTDLIYTYEVDNVWENYKVCCVPTDTPVPSITDIHLAAFVFENEARELFGVALHDIAIDFGGHMYSLTEPEPMTVISPEFAAAKEKQRKAAAAKAAKEAAAKKKAQDDQASEKKSSSSNTSADQPGESAALRTPNDKTSSAKEADSR